MEIFRFQAAHNPLYGRYLSLLKVDVQAVASLAQIPYLPIQFFKNYTVKTGEWQEEAIFTSSGTTSETTSRHYVRDLDFYKRNTVHGFQQFYGNPADWLVLALLPSYLERTGSSLVVMAEHFIQLSKHPQSGFFLNNVEELVGLLKQVAQPLSLPLTPKGEPNPGNTKLNPTDNRGSDNLESVTRPLTQPLTPKGEPKLGNTKLNPTDNRGSDNLESVGSPLGIRGRITGNPSTLQSFNPSILLLSVSFALLDLAERHSLDLQQVTIMETGGMKGRRRELTRSELHEALKTAFNAPAIHSEYGMTELFSQAYSKGDGLFYPAPTLRASTREITDPLTPQQPGKTGILNLIDLANLDSCSFIATDDLGRVFPDGSFEVLGRADSSDVRGCNLMVADG